MMNVKLFVISAFALVQVHQATSFSVFGGNAPPTPAEPSAPNHGQEGQGAFAAIGHKIQQAQIRIKSAFAGNSGLMGHNYPMHAQQNMFHLQFQGRKQFYDKCGVSSRRCEWVPRDKHMKHAIARTQQQHVHQAENSIKPEMDFVCSKVNHVCVGNTETCIANRSCDVALKIVEVQIIDNGKTTLSTVSSVSHLNNCNMDAQSVTDGSKMPQMLFAVGFTTFDESGQNLECRIPKASDFKLVFLWKNTTEEANGFSQVCTEKPKEQEFFAVKHYDFEMMQAIATWPTVCKGMEKKDGEGFNLKSFLLNHVPETEYTSFFSPPFDFADNYEPKYSSNGMVISGTV